MASRKRRKDPTNALQEGSEAPEIFAGPSQTEELAEAELSEDSTIRGQYYRGVALDNRNDPRSLMFLAAEKGSSKSFPRILQNLRREIDGIESMLNLLFADNRELRLIYFTKLRIAAEIGLCDCSTAICFQNIEDIKNTLVISEFPRLRAKLWRTYFLFFVLFTVSLGTIGMIVYEWGDFFSLGSGIHSVVVAALWIPVGATLGIFTEFFMRTVGEIKYEELKFINPGRWNTVQRVINILVTAYLFAFLLGIGVIQIGVGNVLLNDFAGRRPYLSILIGFITGFAFPYVRDVSYRIRPVNAAVTAK